MSGEIKIRVDLPCGFLLLLRQTLSQQKGVEVNVKSVCGDKAVLIITVHQENKDEILGVISSFARRYGLISKRTEPTPTPV